MRLSERGQEQNGYGHVYVCVCSFFLLMAIWLIPSDAICVLSVEDKPVYSIANIRMMAFAPLSVEGNHVNCMANVRTVTVEDLLMTILIIPSDAIRAPQRRGQACLLHGEC